MKKRNIILFLFLFSGILAIHGETMSLNTADTAPYSTEDNRGFYDVLLTTVFNQLSIDVQINHYPSERSISRVDAGYDDGEYARISGLSHTYSNLIQVNEPLVSFDFIALKLTETTFNLNSWNDLKDLRTGYLRGWKIYEDNVGDGENVTILNNVESLFSMLLTKRIDVALYSRLRAMQYIRENGIDGIEIVSPVLSERPMYLYLHRKHKNLAPVIAEKIASMKETGEYEALYEAYLLK